MSYPKYGEAGFNHEYYNLATLPNTAEAAYRQLATLNQLKANSNHGDAFAPRGESRRFNRTLRMFHAFRRKEARK